MDKIETLRKKIRQVQEAREATDSIREFRLLGRTEDELLRELAEEIRQLPIKVRISYEEIVPIGDLYNIDSIAHSYVISGNLSDTVKSIVQDGDDISIYDAKVEIV